MNRMPKNPAVRRVTVPPSAPVGPVPVVQLPPTTPTAPGTRQIQPIPPLPRGAADRVVRPLT